MKTLQTVAVKLLSIGILAGGVALVAIRFSDLYQHAICLAPDNAILRIIAGAVLILLGVLGVLPSRLWRKKGKTIAFPGTHGDLIIQLNSIEAALQRAATRLPEVKKLVVRVEPEEDNQKVTIHAEAWLFVGTGTGVTETGERVRQFIAENAADILGEDVVVATNLSVVKSIPPKSERGESLVKPAYESASAAPEPTEGAQQPPISAEEGLSPRIAESERESLLPGNLLRPAAPSEVTESEPSPSTAFSNLDEEDVDKEQEEDSGRQT